MGKFVDRALTLAELTAAEVEAAEAEAAAAAAARIAEALAQSKRVRLCSQPHHTACCRPFCAM